MTQLNKFGLILFLFGLRFFNSDVAALATIFTTALIIGGMLFLLPGKDEK
jgi:hypothetical protein